MTDFDDPFVTNEDSLSVNLEQGNGALVARPRVMLPLGLLAVAFVGMTLPWVVIRPLGENKSHYNITDVPGGLGIAWTLALVAIPGVALLFVGRRSGLVTLSVVVGVLGWMATISGLLLGVITSLLPSLDVAGVDLTKAQAGQGIGVPITVLASLALGVMAVHSLSRSVVSPSRILIPLFPPLILVPLILIGVNHHLVWLSLGSSEVGYGADLPGDALYGSGLLIVAIWVSVGIWIISLVIQKRSVMLFGSVLTLIVGGVSTVYSALVWVGGKAVTWLLPDAADRWTSVEVETPLVITLICGIMSIAASLMGLSPKISGRIIDTNALANLGQKRVSWNSLVGALLLCACLVVIIARIVK